MFSSNTASVLILADEASLARRWSAWLEEYGCRAWSAPEALPATVRPDCILTNRPIAAVIAALDRPQLAQGHVGVVAVGRGGPADVTLPVDATPREIALACRLLGEMVRLRRQVRRGARLRRALTRLALTDAITGLPNRRAWDEELAKRLSQPRGRASDAERLCLAILDLDHFKRINDTLGHAAGDKLLKAAGRVLRRSLAGQHFLARLGGDEFGVLAWTDGGATAGELVERVRKELACGLAAVSLAATASAGYCVEPAGAAVASSEVLEASEGLFQAADEAMRSAKAGGRDTSRRAVRASPDLSGR
ncbi:MAG: GGDEF domain-containing protein [Pirellulales bacterium]